MTLLIAALILVAGIAAFFAWVNRQVRRRHARFTDRNVIRALENGLGLDDEDDPLTAQWVEFLRWPIDDPYLDSVRQRCRSIVQECGDDRSHWHVYVEPILRELQWKAASEERHAR